MRKEFASAVAGHARRNDALIFLTGDLGFMALEELRESMGGRFINVGVCEQNMVAMAAGLASMGYMPICYSIAPFAVFRPAEQIRLDICLHNMNVKIVGNGGGYGYGIMGPTHHAIEDIAFMSSLQNMRCYIPFVNDDVGGAVDHMLNHRGPGYLRLGFGARPSGMTLPPYHPVRQLATGDMVTIIGTGPVLLNCFHALELLKGKVTADIIAVSELPLRELSVTVRESVTKTGCLLVVEEHVRRGGLGENLAVLALEAGIHCRFFHAYAKGYPNGLYGSQSYHQKICGLDAESLAKILERTADGRYVVSQSTGG